MAFLEKRTPGASSRSQTYDLEISKQQETCGELGCLATSRVLG